MTKRYTYFYARGGNHKLNTKCYNKGTKGNGKVGFTGFETVELKWTKVPDAYIQLQAKRQETITASRTDWALSNRKGM